MPTYEYLCTECGEPLEVVQSIHDRSLTRCPSCGGNLRKVFGNVGVVFKGSGFYKTDSRSADAKQKKAAAARDSKSDGDSGAAGSGTKAADGTSTSKPTETAPARKSSDSESSGGGEKPTKAQPPKTPTPAK